MSEGKWFKGARWTAVVCVVATVAAMNIAHTTSHLVPLDAPWQDARGTLLDFRDLITLPGRFLWAGGNPYDPHSYLAAHPQAQEFDVYAPVWLVYSAALAWMPFRLAAITYMAMGSLISFAIAKLLAGWFGLSRSAPLFVGLLACFLQVWFPARNASSSFLVVCGLLFAVVHCTRRGPRNRWLSGMGMAICMVKPQFGVPLALFLVVGGFGWLVWRGLVLVVSASLIPLAVCVHAAGGLGGFVRSVNDDVHQALSSGSSASNLFADNYRGDVVGLFLAFTHHEAPLWVYAVPMVLALLAALYAYRNQGRILIFAVGILAMLLLPAHFSYDVVALICVEAILVKELRVAADRFILVAAILCGVPIMHPRRLSTVLFGWGERQADLFNTCCMTLALLSLLAGLAVSRSGCRKRRCLAAQDLQGD